MNTKEIIYKLIDEEKISYINHKLIGSSGMIAHYKDLTAIIVDDKTVKGSIAENTVLIQELGHYHSGAYYRTNSPFELIEKMEFKADKKAWEIFFPYPTIKNLMKNGLTTVSQLADYFEVEPSYLARCINYYYNQYGFNN